MQQADEFQRATVTINYPGGAITPDIYCPVTGRIVHKRLDPDAGEEVVWEDDPDWGQIPTVTFHYTSLAGDFSYLHPNLAAKIEASRQMLGDDGNVLDDFEVLKGHVASLGRAPLVLHLRSEGQAGGRVEISVYIGLDLAETM